MIERPARRSWFPLLFIVLALLLLVLHEAGYLTPLESALGYVVGPLQRAVAALVEGVGDLFQVVGEVRELRQRVEELEAINEALTLENVRLREYEAENQQLRSLLNFAGENPTLALLGADVLGQEACESMACGEVVGLEPNPYLRYMTISVGAQNGVEVGMPVVAGGPGLVGRVAEVGPRTSKVQLLTDPSSAVVVLIQSSRAIGLVVGQPDGSLRLRYVPQADLLNVGDIVVTSGLGGVLPRGLVVGQVAEVVQSDIEPFQEAVVRPGVDFSRVETVLVVTHFERLPGEELPPAVP